MGANDDLRSGLFLSALHYFYRGRQRTELLRSTALAICTVESGWMAQRVEPYANNILMAGDEKNGARECVVGVCISIHVPRVKASERYRERESDARTMASTHLVCVFVRVCVLAGHKTDLMSHSLLGLIVPEKQ